MHVVTALAAGLLIVPLLAYLLNRLGIGFGPIDSMGSPFWGAVGWGSLLAAVSVYRHQRLSLAWAGAIGVTIVSLLLIAPLLWERALS